MNTSTFRTNLKTLLDARSNLSSINTEVHKYPPGDLARSTPTLFFGNITVDQEDASLLPSDLLERTYTVEGGGYAPGGGATDALWATLEGTANTLVTELQDTLLADQSVGTACTQARLTNWTLTPSQGESGKVFMQIDWTVVCRDIS